VGGYPLRPGEGGWGQSNPAGFYLGEETSRLMFAYTEVVMIFYTPNLV